MTDTTRTLTLEYLVCEVAQFTDHAPDAVPFRGAVALLAATSVGFSVTDLMRVTGYSRGFLVFWYWNLRNFGRFRNAGRYPHYERFFHAWAGEDGVTAFWLDVARSIGAIETVEPPSAGEAIVIAACLSDARFTAKGENMFGLRKWEVQP